MTDYSWMILILGVLLGLMMVSIGYTYKSALEEIREKAQHCIKQDVCALCDYSKECAVPDADGLVYDNNRLLIKLINEVLNG